MHSLQQVSAAPNVADPSPQTTIPFSAAALQPAGKDPVGSSAAVTSAVNQIQTVNEEAAEANLGGSEAQGVFQVRF